MKRSRRHWWWLLLAIAIGVLLGRWLQRPAPPPPLVKIEDGRTIDFSSGQPVVSDEAADRAALAKAQREIDEAVADVKFAPTKPGEKDAPPAQPE